MLKFDVEKTVLYWFESAEYDMGVAEAMYEKAKYPYALFMGHLALEKLLKALVVKTTRKHALIRIRCLYWQTNQAFRFPKRQ